ncbi:Sigma54 dependent transcriptional regulator [Nitrospira sp. KM1]|uniref:sigma-54-dependent transcriptional regulator n=1 Tax=Nitrospira sp. KM1 TaxID=1936990 RepID=UPI0013A776FB|nr:sigma-54 dependent transcriptional regulator [Nitrospira sp. KM1]BCA55180.1 Sigma54 dependent transcriptional regulator [Nitrospira sp. KM1]
MNAPMDKVFTILFVEDNGGDVEMFLRTIEDELPREEDEEVELVLAARAEGGLKILDERRIDLVITEIRLPGMNGIEFLQRIQARDRRIPVIIMSWVDTVDTAVEAMRCGAFDYVTKPFEKMDLAARIHRAMRISEILFRYEPAQQTETLSSKELIGVSPPIRHVMAMIEAAARVQSTTLIIGETGTGKELIARAIHERSAERDGPFQVVDCTTFSEGTVDSELFGHVRGAFTGAVGDKLGLIERGIGGTLFLDEIGDLPLPLQAKLLRVLEEGEMRAVGSVQMKKVSARFIAATNQELAEKVKRNEFRKDLFFRLNVMAIKVPPLRDRSQDIPLLARHFMARYAKEFGKPVTDLLPSAVTELVAYPWPGNVRELRNVMERAVMLAKGNRISSSDVLGMLQFTDQARRGSDDDYLVLPYAKAKEKVLEDFSRRYIQSKLDHHNGNVTHAAEESGLPRPYFYEIMRRFLKTDK